MVGGGPEPRPSARHPLPAVESGEAGAGGPALRSDVLGLDVCVEEGRLRFFDPERGEYLRSFEESEAELEAERVARRREQAAREAAEARVAELEARLRALPGT